MKKYISVGAVVVVCLLVLSGCTEQQRKDNGQIDPDVRDEQVDTNTNELLEQAISDAILSHNKDVFRDGDRQTFTTEYHEVIKVVSSENTVEVYLLALYAQYQYEDGEADLTGASSMPCAITFEIEDGTYSVKEYWEPEDGENYKNSIREKFPDDIDDVDLELPSEAMDVCNQRANEFFENGHR